MIKELTAMLENKEISCAELTRRSLDACSSKGAALNAFITLTGDEAMAAAKKADDRISRGEAPAPLGGIPVSLKDNICTRAIRTTCASKMLSGHRPIYDAAVWERLKLNGAVLLGKNNMDEFAMGSTGETSFFGPALNPHDNSRVAGGSSGGGAAAVAAGLAAYALGSDTGGSVRQPASFCGIVGLKPTYGAVSRYGLIAYASSLDQIGIMARSVEDAAAVFDEIAFADKRDMTCAGAGERISDELPHEVGGLKIAVVREFFDGADDEVKDAVLKAAELYRELGAEVEEISLPQTRYMLAVYYILACAEASSNLGRYDGVRCGA